VRKVIGRKRHADIVQAVQSGGVTSVRQLAEQLNVSESTIRRDLRQLDRNGELTRTYGGAVITARRDGNGRGLAEQPFSVVMGADSTPKKNKDRMAVRAAQLVPDDSVVLLDIGVTTALLARHLRGRPITVISSSLGVLDELRDDDTVRVIMLGGVLRRNYQTLVGSLTEAALAQISADIVFLSCTGIRPNGLVVDDMPVEAPIKHAMFESAERRVLFADEERFPGHGSFRLCSVTDVEVLITTGGAHETTIQLCRDAGGEVLIA
jgi:DeoR/GlpR family transcriptional regulator of sugar metabolism